MNFQSIFSVRVKDLKENYNPLNFLSSLGAGELMVSFFMYFQFLIPHNKFPMVTFEHIKSAFESGANSVKIGITITYLFIIFFTLKHFQLLW